MPPAGASRTAPPPPPPPPPPAPGRPSAEKEVNEPVPDERAEMPVASPEHLSMMKAVAMKGFPHRALYEGEDVRTLLKVPGVDREAIRDYFARHGLLELFDAIERAD